MADVLHLLTTDGAGLARTVIDQHVRAGDHVTVVVLSEAAPADWPAPVTVRRIAGDLSYAELLDLIFAADRVVAW